jgi:hypothetical protein
MGLDLSTYIVAVTAAVNFSGIEFSSLNVLEFKGQMPDVENSDTPFAMASS